MNISTHLRIWFAINNIQQKDFSEKYRIPGTTISETLKGMKKKVPEKFKMAFQKQFGFPVENVYEHIKSKLENNTPETGKESQINKSKEGGNMEGKLYDVEGLSQERIDIIQEMIDNWKVEDANKRKEERRKRTSITKSKKSKSA